MNEEINITGFSFSALSTFESCPRAYKFRYIEKITEAFSTIETHMGTSVHETLEWAYHQRQKNIIPSFEMALDHYKTSWNLGDFSKIKIVKDERSLESYYNEGKVFIDSYFQRVFLNDDSTTIDLEHQFKISLSDDIIFRGVIDRISKEANGTIRVTDYKTGRVGHPLDTLQLPSYAVYIFQHNIDTQINLCFEDLRQNKTVVVPFNRKEVKSILQSLRLKIKNIKDTYIENFIPKPSILCKWCGYNQLCESPHESIFCSKDESLNQLSPPSSPQDNHTDEMQTLCPSCGGQLKERNGKFGSFLGCSRFPECRYTLDLNRDQNSPASNPNIDGKDICPECGSILRQRKGKFGPFMGCSNYPQCRFTRPL